MVINQKDPNFLFGWEDKSWHKQKIRWSNFSEAVVWWIHHLLTYQTSLANRRSCGLCDFPRSCSLNTFCLRKLTLWVRSLGVWALGTHTSSVTRMPWVRGTRICHAFGAVCSYYRIILFSQPFSRWSEWLSYGRPPCRSPKLKLWTPMLINDIVCPISDGLLSCLSKWLQACRGCIYSLCVTVLKKYLFVGSIDNTLYLL